MCIQPVLLRMDGRFTTYPSYIPHHELEMREGVYVPCGHCPECYKAKQDEWFTRFALERLVQIRRNPRSWVAFFTLTYASQFLPSTREQSITDIQTFRKNLNRYGFKRYYFIQEFGDTNNRVHFHGLLFGCEGDLKQLRNVFNKCWTKGRSNVQNVRTNGALRYVGKYTTKSLNVYADQPWTPYSSCSQRPALGSEYISEDIKALLSSNPELSLRTPDGYMREPRSWAGRLRTDLAQIERKHWCIRNLPHKDYDDDERDIIWSNFEDRLAEYHRKKMKHDFEFQVLQDSDE